MKRRYTTILLVANLLFLATVACNGLTTRQIVNVTPTEEAATPIPATKLPAIPPPTTSSGRFTATPAPSPTEQTTPISIPPTETAVVCTHGLNFISDVTVPMGSTQAPGNNFVKTWRVQNNGSCAWDAGSAWLFAGGAQLNGPNTVNVPVTMPGETTDISVSLTAPTAPGTYTSLWNLRLPNGAILDNCCTVQIIVPAATATPTATPLPTVTPLAVMARWRGEYWSNPYLTGPPVLEREDRAITFRWKDGAPAENLPHDNFSTRWTRNLNFVEGIYIFTATVDGGMRLYLDNDLLIDAWEDETEREITSEQWIETGIHTLRVEYYESSGDSTIQLQWAKDNRYPEWRGSYWSNQQLSDNPTIVRNDKKIDFDWGLEGPTTGLPDDNFSVRWTRHINFEPGLYRFHTMADDGVRVYVDDRLIIDQWHESSADRIYQTEIALEGHHIISVIYFDAQLEAQVRFWIKRSDSSDILQ